MLVLVVQEVVAGDFDDANEHLAAVRLAERAGVEVSLRPLLLGMTKLGDFRVSMVSCCFPLAPNISSN